MKVIQTEYSGLLTTIIKAKSESHLGTEWHALDGLDNRLLLNRLHPFVLLPIPMS